MSLFLLCKWDYLNHFSRSHIYALIYDIRWSVFKWVFFSCRPFLKPLLSLLQYCFCFMLWFLFYVLFYVPGMWDLSFLNQGSNPHPLHWKSKSHPLDHQGSPTVFVFKGKIPSSCMESVLREDERTQGREGLTCVPSKHSTNSIAILQWTGYQVDIHFKPNLIFTTSAWADLDLIILLLHYKVCSQFKNDSSLIDPSCYALNEQWWLIFSPVLKSGILQALTSSLLFIWVLS